MATVVVGIAGTLLGVLVSGVVQRLQAARARAWQRADSLADAKRRVYTEYLRAVSASYAQAMSGQRERSEDAALLAATAEIEILAGREVAAPARLLTGTLLDVHARIAGAGTAEAAAEDADRRRRELVDLFKADLGIRTGS
ncbi:hypothetical protein [Actinomadura macrotermitis]|uniref:Uncharacterized protein n=1 Tax=Actinomadura macrotermitis TaxID=2585200 RepID=A0A7K0C862_9ACTN|nr:hypothetical protein [Actinomadura macrotermitis]MQY09608.1 hypothetical protein [Actinomadura macrotermitis]